MKNKDLFVNLSTEVLAGIIADCRCCIFKDDLLCGDCRTGISVWLERDASDD